MKIICICGGGSLGHVIAGFLSSKDKIKVNILTNQPQQWHNNIDVFTPEGDILKGKINKVSNSAQDVVCEADIVLLCLPGFLIRKELEKIRPYLKSGAFVGSVFSSTGFFFEAMTILSNNNPLWGFQRVPFIARINEYGVSANLLGYKDSYNIAVERTDDISKIKFSQYIEKIFERPVRLLTNYLEASLTNSNPILHTARLYNLFANWEPNFFYSDQIPFYSSWTVEASQLLIEMDKEFFELLSVLPVSKNYLPNLLKHYESTDAESLTRKIASIESFKTIMSPMKKCAYGWIPDFESRYFIEDFLFGLRYIYDLSHKNNVKIPTIDMVYNWGVKMIDNYK